jgi:hypothetical protein
VERLGVFIRVLRRESVNTVLLPLLHVPTIGNHSFKLDSSKRTSVAVLQPNQKDLLR